MTFDKATYTIDFPPEHDPEQYVQLKQSLASPYVNIETMVLDDGRLQVTVHGDCYVIPITESKLKRLLPQNATLDCDVTIGGGSKKNVATP